MLFIIALNKTDISKLCPCADMPTKKDVKVPRKDNCVAERMGSETPPLVRDGPSAGSYVGLGGGGGGAVGTYNTPPLIVLRPVAVPSTEPPVRIPLAIRRVPSTEGSDDDLHEDTEAVSPSLLSRVTPTYIGDQGEVQREEEEEEEEEEDEDEDEDEDATDDKKPGDKKDEDKGDEVSISPFDLANEMSLSNGFKSVIARNLQQVVSVDDCAEILSLCSLHFRFLKGEI